MLPQTGAGGGGRMREIDQENLDTAIALGSAVCDELGLCCDRRGRVIFHIYRKLAELKSGKPVASQGVGTPVTDEPENK
ncbi:hypothetical protein ACFLY3_04665 [Chloroflexota bacterium]